MKVALAVVKQIHRLAQRLSCLLQLCRLFQLSRDARERPASRGTPRTYGQSLRSVLDEYDSIRPYYHAFIEALARSARSPELRQQLAAHYNRQRDRVAGWIADSLGDTLEHHEARHLASLLIGTADGMLIQSFIDADDAPTSRELRHRHRQSFRRRPQATPPNTTTVTATRSIDQPPGSVAVGPLYERVSNDSRRCFGSTSVEALRRGLDRRAGVV